MNKDFHFHGTFFAAFCAGYTPDEATEIAKAAQLVDDLTETLLKERGIEESYLGPTTCMTTGEMRSMNLKPTSWSRDDQRRFNEIWTAFHFLPGNQREQRRYMGPASGVGWSFTGRDERRFKLMCVKNSPFARQMIQNAINEHPYGSELHNVVAGMCMHVFADTWSHHLFLGQPRWFANQYTGKISVKNREEAEYENAYMFDAASVIGKKDDLEKLSFLHTPDMASYESISYLGHGRMGCIPDYPCLKFRYTPRWSACSYVRDNTREFLAAFHHMLKALICLRGGEVFTEGIANVPDLSAQVLPVLSTRAADQSEAWLALITEALPAGTPPPVYDPNEWPDEYKTIHDAGGDLRLSRLSKFAEAAQEHIGRVNDELARLLP